MLPPSSTSNGYVTDVAYLPGFYPAMAPSQMRYVASLQGVRPPKTDRSFSYLELGCGFGSTLLALAAANPQGEFTGIDFMPVHTDRIARESAASGIDNLRVICADFTALPSDVGKFDFIVLHGVFSWISPELRRCVLELIRRHLKPGGLVEVTYNCMPGWASLLPVRTLLRHFAEQVKGDSVDRVTFALKEVERLRKADIPLFHDQPLAVQLVDKLLAANPHYVAHEYLNEHWTAFEAGDVQEQFKGIGLRYAGRLPVHHNSWQLCAQQTFADQFSGLDESRLEMLKDHHANVMFRWDIYSTEKGADWSARERAEAIADICFRLDSPDLTLPHTVKYGPVEAGINGPPHDKLLEVMGQSSWTLPELLAHPELSSFSPELLTEAIDTGVALKLFRVEGGPIDAAVNSLERINPGSLGLPLCFNQRAIACENLTNEQVVLASTRTQSGHPIGDLYTLVLDELMCSGSDAIEVRVADRLIAADKHLREQKTGRPITDRSEMVHAAREICGDFLSRILPELFRQGIIERKGN